jgi:sec-independent protein translocase protein TatC
MSNGTTDRDFAEDLHFEHTRMSFWDHIEELRTHLWRAIIGFVVAMVVAVPLAFYVTQFIASPVEAALQKFYDERAMKAAADPEATWSSQAANKPTPFTQMGFDRRQLLAVLQGKPAAEVNSLPRPWSEEELKQEKKEKESKLQSFEPEKYRAIPDEDIVKLWSRVEEPVVFESRLQRAQRLVGRRPALSTLSITEGILVYFKVAMYLGIVLASPWIFIQLWSFIAAGLYPAEKNMVNVYLPFSIGLFLAGVALCEFVVLPYAVTYLLGFNEWLGLEPDLRLNDWLSFAVMFPLVFGLAFQTPLVMLFFNRLGIIPVETYQKNRRMAMFGMACLAILLAASPDAFSMISLTVPLWILYEVGILLCKMYPQDAFAPEEETDAEQLVQV